MTRDYLDRPVELLLMDGFLLASIEHIARLQDEDLVGPLILALGVVNFSTIVATNKKLADAENARPRMLFHRLMDPDILISMTGELLST